MILPIKNMVAGFKRVAALHAGINILRVEVANE